MTWVASGEIPFALTKKESFHEYSDALPDSGIVSHKEFKKDLGDSSEDSNKASPDNGLPFKKRKPRFADFKMDYLGNETLSDSYSKDEESLRFDENDHHYTSPTNNSKECTCAMLRRLEGSLSLCGKFNSWSKEQVQLWLWKTLRDSNKGFSVTTICETLQCIREENGFDLSCFSKLHWQQTFATSNVPYELIREYVSERLKDGPFRPHNFSEPPQREINPTNLNVCSPKEILMASGAGATALPKRKANKPQRKRRDKCVGQLWEFVFNMLNSDATNPSVVCWEDKEKRLFRIVNTEEIARLWGKHKGNSNMTYANMSRTMRYYREGNGAFVRNERKRVYGFGPKADFDRLLIKSARKH